MGRIGAMGCKGEPGYKVSLSIYLSKLRKIILAKNHEQVQIYLNCIIQSRWSTPSYTSKIRVSALFNYLEDVNNLSLLQENTQSIIHRAVKQLNLFVFVLKRDQMDMMEKLETLGNLVQLDKRFVFKLNSDN